MMAARASTTAARAKMPSARNPASVAWAEIWATVCSAVVSCKAAGEGDDPVWLAIRERTCGITDAAKSPALTRLERAAILLLVALRAAAAATVAGTGRPIEPPICWPTLSVRKRCHRAWQLARLPPEPEAPNRMRFGAIPM